MLNKEYWEDKYLNGYTGWDIGNISPPMKGYFDGLRNKEIRILIPGGGNGYEAEYLHNNGFINVYLLDWSEIALKNFSDRAADFPKNNLICENFFEHSGKYDLIMEQTFFCAIETGDRRKYAEKMYDLLNEKGTLSGLLFDCEFEHPGPPFGGNETEYKNYFEDLFEIKVFEKCRNSLTPRHGRELFMILEKK